MRMTKRFGITIGGLAVAAATLVGCAPTSGATGDTSTEDAPSLIYITNDPIGINEFLQLGKDGTEAAAAAIGGTATTFESDSDEQSMRANVEAALDESPTAIILITFDFTALAVEYATANPEQPFVLVDDCPTEDVPENLYCGVFTEHEGAYLLGVEAGMLTETGKVGSVGALDIPFIHRYTDSFALGAQSVDAAITDTQLFVGGDNPFADPVGAKEAALAVQESGADQIFAVTAGGNGGIFEAATETGTYSYGVDVNQCAAAPGTVVDNVIKAVDVVIANEVDKIVAGESGGTATAYGLASGGLSLTSLTADAADSGCLVMDYPEIITAVEEARDAIIAGDIVVPDPVTAG
ncbi:MAG: BMP family ABC transporter substrate-binding protein [Microbacterium sp.]